MNAWAQLREMEATTFEDNDASEPLDETQPTTKLKGD